MVIIKNPLTDEETMRLEYGEGTHHHCVHSGSYLEIREIDVVDPSVELAKDKRKGEFGA